MKLKGLTDIGDMIDAVIEKGWLYNKEIDGHPVFRRFEYNNGDSYDRWCILISSATYELTHDEVDKENIDYKEVMCR